MPSLGGQQVAERAAAALAAGDLDAYARLLAPDVVETRHQLGERFVGRENVLGMYRDQPAWPTISWRGVRGGSGTWIAEGTIEYGEGPVQLVAVMDVRDGLLRRNDLYFAPTMQSPPYHAKWAEKK